MKCECCGKEAGPLPLCRRCEKISVEARMDARNERIMIEDLKNGDW